MSVANLEAFALEKGITKAFNSMSQQEQTMLRYQYLMKATADAQGDFARTSDGFANASRRVETAWESIKTKIGSASLPGVEDALGQIAKVMEALTQEPEETLFDKIKAIDIDAQGKLADIQAVADEASKLIAQLGIIAETDTKDAISSLASGANSLKASAPGTWQAFFGSLKNIDGLQNLFGEGSKADENIRNLVSALTSNTFDDTKANAWKTLLDSFGENAEGLTKLTGKSAENTKKWLEGIASAVNSIDPTNADAWDKMLTTLVSGFATDTPEGQQFISGLAESFLAMGSDSDAAIKGLQALGYSSEQIASKQAEWLKTVQQLKETIPGLSSVVDEETGAITGGYGALQKYVSEWKATQDKLIYWKAYYAKREALAETQGQLDSMYVEAGGAQWAVDNYLKNHPEINKLYKSGGMQAVQHEGGKEGREFFDLWNNATDAQNKYQTALAQTSAETQKLANEEQFLTENYALTEEELEQVTNAYGDAGDASGEFGGKSVETWTEVTQNVYDSIKALKDYVKTVRDATSQAVSSVVNGFNQVQRPGEQAALKIEELQKKLQEVGETSKEGLKIKAQIDELQASVNEFSPEKITTNLQSQMSFMEHYMENLEFMRGKVSNEFLASLSDGSKESAEYLSQMVDAWEHEQGADVQKVDKLYQQVQTKKEEFIDALTQQKLTVDETYEALAKTAAEAMEKLNLSTESYEAATETVGQYAQGISDKTSDVATAVDGVLAEAGRLVGSVNFNDYLPSGYNGNVDLSARPHVKIEFVTEAGWVDEEGNPLGGDYATVLTNTFSVGKQDQGFDFEYDENAVINITPILADGTVLSPEALEDYVAKLASDALSSGKSIKEIDAEQNNLLLSYEVVPEGMSLDEAYAEAGAWAENLHELQAAWDEAQAAVEQDAAGLDQSGTAYQATASTISAIASALQEHEGEVSAAVDAIIADLNKLNNFGVHINMGKYGSISFNLNVPQHETGLDWVPFNGYLAQLHEGESVLTAEENRVWQRFKSGGASSRNSIDYDALGGVMRDNITPGGNVYLDGRIVGAVISKAQGESYRALQRSGWQG